MRRLLLGLLLFLGAISSLKAGGFWNEFRDNNAGNELTGLSDPAFPGGNRTVAYSYDADGERTAKTQTSGPYAPAGYPAWLCANSTYTYDAENRLVNVIVQDPHYVSGQGTVYDIDVENEYAYDYRGRRVFREEWNGLTNTGNFTDVMFSGGTSEREYNAATGSAPAAGTGNLAVEFIRGSDWGGGVGGILYSSRSGENYYYHYDGRGDVIAQTVSGTDQLTYQAAYDAYGMHLAITQGGALGVTQQGFTTEESGTDLDRFRANTKEEDPNDGLSCQDQRILDLDSDTWLTQDPAGFVDGPNVYAYVKQNPWTKFDPEGLQGAAPADGEEAPPTEANGSEEANDPAAANDATAKWDDSLRIDPVKRAEDEDKIKETGGDVIDAPEQPAPTASKPAPATPSGPPQPLQLTGTVTSEPLTPGSGLEPDGSSPKVPPPSDPSASAEGDAVSKPAEVKIEPFTNVFKNPNGVAKVQADSGEVQMQESQQQQAQPRPTTLQTGGNTIAPGTARVLGLEPEDAKDALEALKKDTVLPSDFHGKIMSNGDYVDPHTGEVKGNIFDYTN
jgi:RHS repeat-associated protein